MGAGEMRDRVTVIVPPNTSDGYGGQTGSPTIVAAGVAAQMEALSARESLTAMAQQSSVSLHVRLWYRDDVQIGYRLRDDRTGESYEIVAIRPDVRRRWIDLDVVGRADDGAAA